MDPSIPVDLENHEVGVDSFSATDLNSVHKRVGHVTVPYKQFIIVWGGFLGSPGRDTASDYCPAHQLWMYNTITELWSLIITEGKVPFKNSGCTGLVHGHYLYIYGGIEELTFDYWRYSNDLYRLNLNNFRWELLRPDGITPLGCDKSSGWVYQDKLYYFGGYGTRPSRSFPEDPSAHQGQVFVPDLSTRVGERGWNNYLWSYNLTTGSWEVPVITSGSPPAPRAAHTAQKSGSKVYIFGGRLGEVRNNDMFVLDLETMTWSHNLRYTHQGPIPEGRSWHSFTFISPTRAIVYGGLNQLGHASQCWWELEIDPAALRMTWKETPMITPLVWHKAAFCDFTGEVIITGGVRKSPYVMESEDHVDEMIILRTCPPSLFRICLDIIYTSKFPYDLTNVPQMLKTIIIGRKCQLIKPKKKVITVISSHTTSVR